ncbi:DUF5017 domain-containing protein [Pedobacter heparinus]|uniref:DUF5017 domain-containing protein n=1 Tax=Pedobacter heparinus TaxID=984 RepID=UPI00292CF808|nr:DUF5017 domain-containing protein [Pedobacter heparinus]
MKLKYIRLILLLSVSFGCKKVNNTEVNDFEVSTAASTFNAGEEVVFKLSGKPFQISFYSGETGKEYLYKDTPKPPATKVDVGRPIKAYADAAIAEFKYVYAVPGTYRVTFIARSATVYTDKESVKNVDITIK